MTGCTFPRRQPDAARLPPNPKETPMHDTAIRQHIIDRVLARRGKLHLFDHLVAARTALVVIDMQGTFCAPGAPAEVPQSRAIVAPINRLATGLRKAGGHVIWVNHANASTPAGSDWSGFFDRFVAAEVRSRTIESLAPGREGQQVWPGMEVQPDDLKILKNRYSALIPGSSSLERVLRSLGIDTLLIAGTKTNICCESTARDAMMMDFGVVMVSDATAALSDDEHRATLETVIQQFGDVLSVDEVISRLI
jgi:ureidoacrylate peracid hydrolase